MQDMSKRILKLLLIVSVFCGVVALVFFLFSKSEFAKKFNSIESMRDYISGAGFWSYSLFCLVQFLQVTFIPIPSMVSTLAGVLIFGPFKTFVLSFFAIILGSIVAFLIGKKFGSLVINWVVGEMTAIKWQAKIQKGKIIFFLMMLLPFFPDDLLCLVAGANKMQFKYFLNTILVSKFIGLLCLCFLGDSFIFNLSSPITWILIGLFIVFVVLFMCFRNKVEVKIEKWFSKINISKKTKD